VSHLPYEQYFRPFPVLHTREVTLRALEMRDAADIYEYARRPEVTRYVTWESYHSIEDARRYLRWILDCYRRREGMTFGIELRGTRKLIGTCSYVQMDYINRTAEIGYTISSDYWNHGLMTQAAAALVHYGFETIGLTRMQGRCMPENAASARVLQKLGMRCEGTLRNGVFYRGAAHDVLLFAMTDGDFRTLYTPPQG